MTSRTESQKNASLYEADKAWVGSAKQLRQKLAGICESNKNKAVRVQTIDGHLYEGVILGNDGCHLHLAVSPSANDVRFFGPSASNAILTLVLYELLVITLLI